MGWWFPVASSVLVLSTWTATTWADVVIERHSRSDGFAGMGAFESTAVTATSATAQREESKLKFTGSFLGAIQKMAGVGDSVRITRLDRDLVWTLDPEKKTYTEAPLTVKGEREHRGPTSGPPRQEKGEPSDVVITRNEFKVDKTGARKIINGFPCEEYVATWLLETRNQKTGETGKSVMTNHLWTTPETGEIRTAQAEEQAYAKGYLQKLKVEMSPEEARNLGMGALAATGLSEADRERALARLAKELAKIQGYTIVSQLEWRTEGSGGSVESRESQPARGGGGPGGMGDLGSALGKLFGGGGQKGGGAETPRTGQEGGAPFFNLYTEVKSIKVTPPDAQRFKVPAGYTRK